MQDLRLGHKAPRLSTEGVRIGNTETPKKEAHGEGMSPQHWCRGLESAHPRKFIKKMKFKMASFAVFLGAIYTYISN